ncbi:LysR family transcriptional regulator [Rhodococcus globerulus]|uniref:LysR family transcriptional regulator n=1 Tax=Rhodococcus globerulus TaxID=33008 RepID=A0ABU4C3H3_RHOGO|nr:LysR family transcriptional regulator [Rhodococcus globerulus]MDV6270979.1 LysR family transcriptional regulator [Rhodococcus globerulus]
MRTEQLEYVTAVTRHGSLRRAAEHLHMSQAALSEAISKLERELGVSLLDRRRSGARISEAGRNLLQHMIDVIEASDRLQAAAGDRLASARNVRVGTVNAGTALLLLPAIQALRQTHPGTSVEVRTLQQDEVQLGLTEGTLDLGLVNLLSGDDVPPELVGLELLQGTPVAVMPSQHSLAAKDQVSADDLRSERFIGMRSGYVMHRFAHRLFGPNLPRNWYTTDGAEMGKMMVAEGLGLTVLPDYSVASDPLNKSGLITCRPISGDRTVIRLTLQQRRNGRLPESVHALATHLREAASKHTVFQLASGT